MVLSGIATLPHRRLPLILFLMLPHGHHGALNVGTDAVDGMVSKLRHSIFIETRHLEVRHQRKCSSLDGPSCFAFASGTNGDAEQRHSRFSLGAVDGPGVIPERLLQDLGVDNADLEFSTPDFNSFQYAVREHEAALALESSPKLLSSFADMTALQHARGESERGILHFAGLAVDGRLPLTFSRGLPNQTVATWDGRWIARDCEAAATLHQCGVMNSAVAQSMLLPAPIRDNANVADGHNAVALTGDEGRSIGSGQALATVVQLTGSVGYLRFSRPVIVRSLYARWQPNSDSVPAIVGGRLGLNGVWTTHIDPQKMRHAAGWRDISGDSLRSVDEIAFLAAPGLEIGAIDVIVDGESSIDLEERPVLVLEPLDAEAASSHGVNDGRPKFTLKLERVAPAAAPFMVSLQEAIEKNLQMKTGVLAQKPQLVEATSASPQESKVAHPQSQLSHQELVWRMVAATNQDMFDHHYLTKLYDNYLVTAGHRSGDGAVASKVESLARAFTQSSASLPSDIRKDLVRERENILEALVGYLGAGGGWSRSTPTTFPRIGSEDALAKYYGVFDNIVGM